MRDAIKIAGSGEGDCGRTAGQHEAKVGVCAGSFRASTPGLGDLPVCTPSPDLDLLTGDNRGDGLLQRIPARVRAGGCVHPITRPSRTPVANAESVLRVAPRLRRRQRRAGRVFPEVDDVRLLDRGHPAAGTRCWTLVEGALLDVVAALGRPDARPGGRRARCAISTGSTTPAVVIHRGKVLGVSRRSRTCRPTGEFYERRQMGGRRRRARHHPHR